jgi:hypothetical protein
MWPKGDNFELGAYRAHGRPVTGPAERGGRSAATRRRRLPLLIVGSLIVAGAGLGTGVALATRHPAGPAPVDTAGNAAVLPDGVHHGYIRRVDIARDRITVDVDQLFLDGDAVKAAVADGKSREDAQYLTVWLRNQDPRLCTLPLAADLQVRFHHTCEEPSDRRAVLTKLAASARLGVYFCSLTVHDGAVHAIKERQIILAC